MRILLLLLIATSAHSQYIPTPENLERRKKFQEDRFGLFIHWGVYSVLGDGEWVMNNQRIPIANYEKLPGFFNPVNFDPAAWVKLVKDAGMRYITITSKHHDGFAMWDSKVSDYNIVKRTPYGKDVLKMLAEECRKQGITLYFYHSQLDWHHPDYFPRGGTGGSYTGRKDEGEWNRYLDYMDAQLTELLTGYGPVGGIWFDGMWDKPKADWRLKQTYDLIHRLQPGALVGSNHHLLPFEGEDFQMFEKDLPGFNSNGFAPEQKIGSLPLETCETINDTWGFNLQDNHHKTPTDLIRYLVKAAGYGANFLLNVGPMPDGRIQPEHADVLRKVGEWLKVNGETIYGTSGGPLTPRSWGVTTSRGNKTWIHLMDWKDDVLTVPGLGKKVTSARLYRDKSALKFTESEMGLSIRIPSDKRDAVNTIIELELR